MILGLVGYARSGKDSVSETLVNKYGFVRVAFADKIRDFLYKINPMVGGEPLQIRVDSDGWDKAKEHSEVRRLLQVTGVAARELFGANFWVNQAMAQIYDPSKNFVITDVRFKNEADFLKVNGAEIWRIERPGIGPLNNHISEKELELITADRTLLNGGTLEELELLVKLRLDSALANKNN